MSCTFLPTRAAGSRRSSSGAPASAVGRSPLGSSAPASTGTFARTPTTTLYLVGSIEERHENYDVLSTGSPLGQALLGHGPGEVVTYEGPRRAFQVEVVSVRPEM